MDTLVHYYTDYADVPYVIGQWENAKEVRIEFLHYRCGSVGYARLVPPPGPQQYKIWSGYDFPHLEVLGNLPLPVSDTPCNLCGNPADYKLRFCSDDTIEAQCLSCMIETHQEHMRYDVMVNQALVSQS